LTRHTTDTLLFFFCHLYIFENLPRDTNVIVYIRYQFLFQVCFLFLL